MRQRFIFLIRDLCVSRLACHSGREYIPTPSVRIENNGLSRNGFVEAHGLKDSAKYERHHDNRALLGRSPITISARKLSSKVIEKITNGEIRP
jgi:hypothetical protein